MMGKTRHDASTGRRGLLRNTGYSRIDLETTVGCVVNGNVVMACRKLRMRRSGGAVYVF